MLHYPTSIHCRNRQIPTNCLFNITRTKQIDKFRLYYSEIRELSEWTITCFVYNPVFLPLYRNPLYLYWIIIFHRIQPIHRTDLEWNILPKKYRLTSWRQLLTFSIYGNARERQRAQLSRLSREHRNEENFICTVETGKLQLLNRFSSASAETAKNENNEHSEPRSGMFLGGFVSHCFLSCPFFRRGSLYNCSPLSKPMVGKVDTKQRGSTLVTWFPLYTVPLYTLYLPPSAFPSYYMHNFAIARVCTIARRSLEVVPSLAWRRWDRNTGKSSIRKIG